jgi:hypothetical protein
MSEKGKQSLFDANSILFQLVVLFAVDAETIANLCCTCSTFRFQFQSRVYSAIKKRTAPWVRDVNQSNFRVVFLAKYAGIRRRIIRADIILFDDEKASSYVVFKDQFGKEIGFVTVESYGEAVCCKNDRQLFDDFLDYIWLIDGDLFERLCYWSYIESFMDSLD